MKNRARLKRAATFDISPHPPKRRNMYEKFKPPQKRTRRNAQMAKCSTSDPFGLGPERVGRWARPHSVISSCARCRRRGGQLNMPVTFDTRSSWGFGVLRSLRRFFWRGLTARPLGAQRSDGLNRLSLALVSCIALHMTVHGCPGRGAGAGAGSSHHPPSIIHHHSLTAKTAQLQPTLKIRMRNEGVRKRHGPLITGFPENGAAPATSTQERNTASDRVRRTADRVAGGSSHPLTPDSGGTRTSFNTHIHFHFGEVKVRGEMVRW